MASTQYLYGLGRRKSATARVRVISGAGKIQINDTDIENYFAGSKKLITEINRPFVALDQVGKYNVSVKVSGGGHAGQVDAIKLGIAKALASVNEEFKNTLRRAELLGRDPRKRERKKFGLKGARKQRQFTKR